MKTLVEKVNWIQSNLKAPKNQRNNFGGYNYRSCEDILEAVKPLLAEKGLVLTVGDEVVQLGDRFYVKATASITDGEHEITNTAYAREALEKKGMDASQITGATSSYARKYALNGLLCIDDTKDADDPNYGKDKGDKNGDGKTPAQKAAETRAKNKLSKEEAMMKYEVAVEFFKKTKEPPTDAFVKAEQLIPELEGNNLFDEAKNLIGIIASYDKITY